MALPNCTYNGQQIVTMVSRKTGLAANTTARAAVLDDINLSLFHISLQTQWDWLATTAANFTCTAGISDYVLPTAAGTFDDVYDVRIVGGNERTLDSSDRRGYDRYNRGTQTANSPPYFYNIYGGQQAGNITLIPTPSTAEIVQMRYYTRQGTISDATSSSLAIADRYLPLVVFKSCSLVSQWKDPERAPFWEQQYSITLARAMDRDRNSPDETPALVPRVEHGGEHYDGLYPNDLTEYPRG